MNVKWLTKQTIVSNEKLFQHCNKCNQNYCSYPNCANGKKFIDHFNKCKFEDKNCQIYSPVFDVFMYHIRKCLKNECDYPYCNLIKKKLKRNFETKLDIINIDIYVQEYACNCVESSIEIIKQNVKDIVNTHYPNVKIEVI